MQDRDPPAGAPAAPGDAPRLPGLDRSIRSRFIDGVNGLRMHILECGHEQPGRPMLLLLHGFPELAYSWRKVMPLLAQAGYYVVAPDQRGYGQTTGWDPDYDGDLRQFRILNVAKDALALVQALGRDSVDAVFGHDFGSSVAAWCALTRPDVFRAVALMSAPFAGPPSLPFAIDTAAATVPARDPEAAAREGLATLARPRKHYQWYYSGREANADMRDCAQGLAAFLRAYYHVKSADWAGNAPYRLSGWSAEDLAQMPTYYIMDRGQDMAQTVAVHMPDAAAVAACNWLPDAELAVYADAYARTGFQGGLQWYRARTSGLNADECLMFSRARITVPSVFISGASDWGVYQRPGDVERMQSHACTRMLGCHLIPGAGHWVQQEQAAETARLLLEFLAAASANSRKP